MGDCTPDVIAHKERVERYVTKMASDLYARGLAHDDSKLDEPEKSTYDLYTPFPEVEFGGEEYKRALEGMGAGLKCHYQANRHHPEHFENGVAGMNLIDIVEMISDWKAASEAKGNGVNLDYLSQRFGISGQLLDVIRNTLEIL